MLRVFYAIAGVVLAVALLGGAVQAQQPPFATTKVEGTDNVYVFRYGNSQAMFVVTSAGVIATDPIGYGRPQAVTTYVEEIKKVTNQPIRYVIYSHHHFDHIAGGKPFKDAGATFIAHKQAKARLERLKDPHTVIPDETVDSNRTITLGEHHTRADLHRPQPFRLDVGHAAAQGEDNFHGRLAASRFTAGPGHDRLLPAGVGRLDQESAGDGLGTADPRPSRHGRAARHQEGRAGHPSIPPGCVGRGEEGRSRGQVLGYGREGNEAAETRPLVQLRDGDALRPAGAIAACGAAALEAHR